MKEDVKLVGVESRRCRGRRGQREADDDWLWPYHCRNRQQTESQAESVKDINFKAAAFHVHLQASSFKIAAAPNNSFVSANQTAHWLFFLLMVAGFTCTCTAGDVAPRSGCRGLRRKYQRIKQRLDKQDQTVFSSDRIHVIHVCRSRQVRSGGTVVLRRLFLYDGVM